MSSAWVRVTRMALSWSGAASLGHHPLALGGEPPAESIEDFTGQVVEVLGVLCAALTGGVTIRCRANLGGVARGGRRGGARGSVVGRRLHGSVEWGGRE